MKKTLRIICYVLVVFICNLPLLATIATSLKTPAQISASPPLLFFKPTLANYAEVLTSPSLHFGTYLRNSFGLALLGTLFSILLALPAAYGMVRHGSLLSFPLYLQGKGFFSPLFAGLPDVSRGVGPYPPFPDGKTDRAFRNLYRAGDMLPDNNNPVLYLGVEKLFR